MKPTATNVSPWGNRNDGHLWINARDSLTWYGVSDFSLKSRIWGNVAILRFMRLHNAVIETVTEHFHEDDTDYIVEPPEFDEVIDWTGL